MFKQKGGGSKAFWTMLKKTALFLRDGFPYSLKLSWNLTLTCQLTWRNQFGFKTQCHGFIEPMSRFLHDSLKHGQNGPIWSITENKSEQEWAISNREWLVQKYSQLTAHQAGQWEGDWLTKCYNERKIILAGMTITSKINEDLLQNGEFF